MVILMLMEPLPDRFSNRLDSILEKLGVLKWVGRCQKNLIGRIAGCNFESKNDVDPFSDDFWKILEAFSEPSKTNFVESLLLVLCALPSY